MIRRKVGMKRRRRGRKNSSLPADDHAALVNTWRPTIAKLIHSDRLCNIKAFLYYPYSDRERN